MESTTAAAERSSSLTLPGRARSLLPALFCLLAALACWMIPADSSEAKSAAVNRTLDSLRTVAGVNEEDIRKYTPQITALSYTSAKAVRALCRLPKISRGHIPQILTLPGLKNIRYSAIPILEYYVTLPGATLAGSSDLLSRLRQTGFVAEQVLVDLPRVAADSAAGCIGMIQHVVQLDEAGQWAARSLFMVKSIDTQAVIAATGQIAAMSMQQKRAAEKSLRTPLLQPAAVSLLLQRLSALDDTAAANISGLLTHKQIAAEELAGWLAGYFNRPTAEREAHFLTLDPQQKTLLLAGLSQAAASVAEMINNLHDITDSLGREIGSYRLSRMPAADLLALFSRLPPAARSQYHHSLRQALAGKDRQRAVSILRQATGFARRQLAGAMSSENIYVLLANGSELYDSSYRDILAPVLITRMQERFAGDLPAFLLAMDPEARLVSDFLSHLAWKGRLTQFFPKDAGRQQDVLKLLAASVLRNEQRLLFFSATFSRLLEVLQPPARSTLLDLLLAGAESGKTVFTSQVRVILQYYLEHYPHLLSRDDKAQIAAMLKRHGPIDLAPYITAPFHEWLADGRLTSLSVFQNDDDGRQSYVSNCSHLLRHGYRPSLSAEYDIAPLADLLQTQVNHIAGALAAGHGENLHVLFRLAGRYPLVIDWQKRVNNVQIVHSVYVYHGKTAQQQLLKSFLGGNHELFAQRGHSYWRNEQLMKPLEQLVQSKSINPELLTAKQRFISIGSCGGIRTYEELTQRFGNRVDILATVGAGKAEINTPYNARLFEIVAGKSTARTTLTWQDIATGADAIFTADTGGEYIQPGSLPAILHKMMIEMSAKQALEKPKTVL